MKISYSFELWDLCGTSYAPFPFDAPRFMHLARRSGACSSLASRNLCPSIAGDPQHRLRSASTECKVGLLDEMAVGAPRLEYLRRNDEHTAAELGDPHLPRPL